MQYTGKNLLLAALVLGIVLTAGAGVAFGLQAQASPHADQETIPKGTILDWPTYSSLKQAQEMSTTIIKGEVLPGNEVPVDLGWREGEILHYVHPVKVTTVLKGTDPGDAISVGQTAAWVDAEPRLEPGREVYLFLNRAERKSSPFEYFTIGAQGQYYVVDGRIETRGPDQLPTREQFEGVEEEVFLKELRKTMER